MKVLRFYPQLSDKEKMLVVPVPAKKVIPDWYKNGESTYIENGKEIHGLKTCKPFLDTLISGYLLLTPFDIHVGKNEDGTLKLSWDGPEEWSEFIGERKGQIGSTIPVPESHRENKLVWSSMWGWKTPRGWSSLLIHPLNRYDLPFTTLSGIIDSDSFYLNGNIPFHLKSDFIGVIPQGTPFAQIIPIKRSSWKSFVDFGLTKIGYLKSHNVRITGLEYKNINWKKKEYQ